MSVRKLKPITPGQRFRVVNGFDAITTDKPERSLIAPIKNSGGRNSQGKISHKKIKSWKNMSQKEKIMG